MGVSHGFCQDFPRFSPPFPRFSQDFPGFSWFFPGFSWFFPWFFPGFSQNLPPSAPPASASTATTALATSVVCAMARRCCAHWSISTSKTCRLVPRPPRVPRGLQWWRNHGDFRFGSLKNTWDCSWILMVLCFSMFQYQTLSSDGISVGYKRIIMGCTTMWLGNPEFS